MARPTAVTQPLGYRVVSYRVDTTAHSIIFGVFPLKSTFLKIAISFPFLIPCLIPPRDDRENTERTPREERQNFFTKFRRFFTQFLHISKKKCIFAPKWVTCGKSMCENAKHIISFEDTLSSFFAIIASNVAPMASSPLLQAITSIYQQKPLDAVCSFALDDELPLAN